MGVNTQAPRVLTGGDRESRLLKAKWTYIVEVMLARATPAQVGKEEMNMTVGGGEGEVGGGGMGEGAMGGGGDGGRGIP